MQRLLRNVQSWSLQLNVQISISNATNRWRTLCTNKHNTPYTISDGFGVICHRNARISTAHRFKLWGRDLWAPASTSHWPALGAACAGQCLLAPRSKERNCLHIPPHPLELFVYVRACGVHRTERGSCWCLWNAVTGLPMSLPLRLLFA